MNTEKKIASYEDACRVLNIQPINEEVFNIFPKEDQRSMLAYHKLTVITRALNNGCLLYTSPSPRDMRRSRMPSSA